MNITEFKAEIAAQEAFAAAGFFALITMLKTMHVCVSYSPKLQNGFQA